MRYSDSLLDEIRSRLPVLDFVSKRMQLRKEGASYVAIDDPSIKITPSKNIWYDFGKGQTGGDIFQFEMFWAKCTFQDAVEHLAAEAGVRLPTDTRQAPKKQSADDGPLGPEPPPADPSSYGGYAPAPKQQKNPREITATYDYVDLDGQMMYQVVREEWLDDGKRKKTFLQRRPYGPIEEDRSKQHWVWGLSEGVYLFNKINGDYYIATKDRMSKEFWATAPRIDMPACPHMLYRFPELHDEMQQDAADRQMVFLCEGEKDVDTLIAWGCVATTNSGGAQNWRKDHAEQFAEAQVVVLLDNDDAGQARGHAVAQSLKDIAASVKTLSWPEHWPGCPPKGDVTDWRDKAGGDLDKLIEIVDRLPEWSAPIPMSSFNAVRFSDLDKAAVPLSWTVKGILQKGTVSLWYGATQSGKSFLAIDIGMAVARGDPWFGYRTVPGLVIHQTGEGGVGFRNRVKAYREHNKIPVGDDIPYIYMPARINLYSDDADTDKLIAEITAWSAYYDGSKLALIVIDTFNAASIGANENSNQDVGRVLERCRRIAETTGAHVMVVHHTPASGDRPRGHSSLMADVETAMAVATSEEEKETVEAADGHVFLRSIHTWTLTKQKEGPSRITKSFTLPEVILGRDEDNEKITSCAVVPRVTASEAAKANNIQKPVGWAELHPSNKDIFKSLVRAIKRKGRIPPSGINCPPDRLAVTVGDWQEELIELAIGHEEMTDAVRKRIKMRIYRASKAWLPDGINLIVKEKDWVWRSPRFVFGIDDIALARPAAIAPEPDPILAPGETVQDAFDAF